MQFREQGKKFQCIRTTYNPATKRGDQKVVATIPYYADKLPSEGLEALTKDERDAFAAWLESKRAASSAILAAKAVDDAPRDLPRLAAGITAHAGLSAEQAAVIWAGLAEVSKALRKAGHPKPKRAQAPAVPAGQADLLASE